MPHSSEVEYEIDNEDRLCAVNSAWDEFARANQCNELAGCGVLGQRIWDYVSDPTLRNIYQVLVAKARGREALLRLTFRCDSPDRYRLLEMDMVAYPDRRVAFCTRILEEHPREPLVILDRSCPRSDEYLVICSVCKRLPYGAEWLELEDAAGRLKLFEREQLPQLTHGVCPDCQITLRALYM